MSMALNYNYVNHIVWLLSFYRALELIVRRGKALPPKVLIIVNVSQVMELAII